MTQLVPLQAWEQILLVYFVEVKFYRRKGCNLEHRQTITFEETQHALRLVDHTEALNGSFAGIISRRRLLENAQSFEGRSRRS